MNILVTGASGFLGQHLSYSLSALQHVQLTACVRKVRSLSFYPVTEIGSIDSKTQWMRVLKDQNIVIHTLGLSYVTNDNVINSLAEFRRVNVDGTTNLARQAAAAGVKRFIFISSIKVNGEQTQSAKPFTADDVPAPEDDYGLSKVEAEVALLQVSDETGMEVVIIRPPLVYGPGVKGNFANMIKVVQKGIPLPLGAVNNQRSLVAIDNLVDFIITCIYHPSAANEVFLVGDGHDLTTTELLQGIAAAMGKPSRLISVPKSVLMFCAVLLGKRAVAQRLLGSLQVDITKARNLLGWEPPISVQEGLRRCFEPRPK